MSRKHQILILLQYSIPKYHHGYVAHAPACHPYELLSLISSYKLVFHAGSLARLQSLRSSSYGSLACSHVRSKSVEQNKLLCYQTLWMLGGNVTPGI